MTKEANQKSMQGIQQNIDEYNERKTNPTPEPEEVYTKALIYKGILFYVSKGMQYVKVPHDKISDVLRRMKYNQVEFYCEVCREQSTEILPNRFYDIDNVGIDYTPVDSALIE